MIRNVTVAVLAVSLILPAALATGQATPRRPNTRPRVRVDTRDGPYTAFAYDSRGRIGVIVNTKANDAGDKVGARIDGITPGGPAEKAGLKAGDVITRFNGTALAGAQSEDDENSGPGMKLIELAHAVDPGDTVQVEYRRGNDARKVTLVAEDLGMGDHFEMPGEMGDMSGQLDRLREMMPKQPEGAFEWSFGSGWGGIEMVKLNPDLGDYFGTREGVLVVSDPDDSTHDLKGCDLIVLSSSRTHTSSMPT